MDQFLSSVGDVVMFWGQGYDTGARYPRTTEAELVAGTEQTQTLLGRPLQPVERAALVAGFRLADQLVEKDGGAPKPRPELDVAAIQAVLDE